MADNNQEVAILIDNDNQLEQLEQNQHQTTINRHRYKTVLTTITVYLCAVGIFLILAAVYRTDNVYTTDDLALVETRIRNFCLDPFCYPSNIPCNETVAMARMNPYDTCIRVSSYECKQECTDMMITFNLVSDHMSSGNRGTYYNDLSFKFVRLANSTYLFAVALMVMLIVSLSTAPT